MNKWSFFLLLIFLFFILTIHPFLSPNYPLQADVLIVEGWIPEASIKIASEEFCINSYELIVTNGKVVNQDSYSKLKIDPAEAAKKELINFGIDENDIYAVKIADIKKSRTYSYALGTVNWLLKNRKYIKAANVLTLGPHARKSWVLYKKAAGNKIDLGIISTPPVNYNPSFWYLSWHGINFVWRDFAGYLYALIL